jgi:hypothetical protein
MTVSLIIVVLGLGITLIAISAWLYSVYAYYLILLSFATVAIADVVASYRSHGSWDLMIIFGDALGFGFMFYFVTVQKITGRKVSSIVSGDEYKTYLLKQNKFFGAYKFIYHLPLVLIVVAFAGGAYWKLMQT